MSRNVLGLAWVPTAQSAAALAALMLALAGGPGAGALAATPAPSPRTNDVGALSDDEAARLNADLEAHLRWQPSDARARVFKARLEMRALRYAEAAASYAKAVAGKPGYDPGVWVEYAEARGMAQGGTLAGEPAKLVQKALSLDANHPQALDLAGSAAWETQDFRQAVVYWKRLLQQLQPGTPRSTELARAVERAEQRARVSLPPPRAAVAGK